MATSGTDSELKIEPPRWTLWRTQREHPEAVADRRWSATPVGTPFLLSPSFQYDSALNAFFLSAEMITAAENTRVGYARDVGLFLDFLTHSRAGTSWRNATEEDHLAYFRWRVQDAGGPRVDLSTWDRELAAVNRFYRWQVKRGNVAECPIPQRQVRSSMRAGYDSTGTTPSTRSHRGGRARVEWLPTAAVRKWRDVGIRGYLGTDVPDPTFRGSWASRNALYVNLMLRTGLRLSEQSGLLECEVPAVAHTGRYHQYRLPTALSKGSSGRTIYIPTGLLRDIHEYVQVDRAYLIQRAQRRGAYVVTPDSLILDRDTRRVHLAGSSASFKMARLTPTERRRVLMYGQTGLEPAALWITETGSAMSPSTWQGIFSQANERCARRQVDLSVHPHMLRHSFAVILLEHLQRGHVAQLRGLERTQRTAHQRVFGDALVWVKNRLGHRSLETTSRYLHTLEDLSMETVMELIPDEWDDPREEAVPPAQVGWG